MDSRQRLRDWLDLRDAIALLGLVLIGVGVGLASIPAALIIVGLLLFGLAVWPAVAAARQKGD